MIVVIAVIVVTVIAEVRVKAAAAVALLVPAVAHLRKVETVGLLCRRFFPSCAVMRGVAKMRKSVAESWAVGVNRKKLFFSKLVSVPLPC